MSGIDGIFAVKGGKAFEAFDHSLPVPAGEVGSADSAAKRVSPENITRSVPSR